jgi:hypothetical protein
MSVLVGSGAVAGAGAAGLVSEGFDWATAGVSEVAVGVGSSFLVFFLKRLLKAFFIWSIASGAVVEYVSDAMYSQVAGCATQTSQP